MNIGWLTDYLAYDNLNLQMGYWTWRHSKRYLSSPSGEQNSG